MVYILRNRIIKSKYSLFENTNFWQVCFGKSPNPRGLSKPSTAKHSCVVILIRIKIIIYYIKGVPSVSSCYFSTAK